MHLWSNAIFFHTFFIFAQIQFSILFFLCLKAFLYNSNF